jgi:hypothetical protein
MPNADWLDTLPHHQKSIVDALLADGISEELAAQAWLDARTREHSGFWYCVRHQPVL